MAMTVENAQSAFRCTGLYPFDRNAIPKDAYNPSTVFERPLTTLQTPEQEQSASVDHPVPAAVASTSQLKVDVNPCVTASVDVSSRNMISTEAVGGSCSFADLISVPCRE